MIGGDTLAAGGPSQGFLWTHYSPALKIQTALCQSPGRSRPFQRGGLIVLRPIYVSLGVLASIRRSTQLFIHTGGSNRLLVMDVRPSL